MKIASQRLSFSSPPNLCALRALCGEFSAPLESQTYKSLFPQLPCFHIHTKCPGVTPLRPPLAVLASSRVSPLCRKPHPFNRLHALVLSCRSFSHSLSLFSMTCGLFLQNAGVGWASRMLLRDTGGWVPLALLSTNVPSSPKWDSHFWLSSDDRNAHDSLSSKAGPMTQPSLSSDRATSSRSTRLLPRTPNSYGPKWSIIPAPASAARLRGRTV